MCSLRFLRYTRSYTNICQVNRRNQKQTFPAQLTVILGELLLVQDLIVLLAHANAAFHQKHSRAKSRHDSHGVDAAKRGHQHCDGGMRRSRGNVRTLRDSRAQELLWGCWSLSPREEKFFSGGPATSRLTEELLLLFSGGEVWSAFLAIRAETEPEKYEKHRST